MKKCRKCKVTREISNFSKDKSTKDNINNCCKLCNKQYRSENNDKIKIYLKEYYIDNLEYLTEYKKEYRINNIDVINKYKTDNNKSIKQRQKNYIINNRDKVNKKRRIYNKNRKQIDPLFKLTCSIRTLINVSIKGNGYSKKSRTYEILGCSFEDFKTHLENQFTDVMTWENAGQWHIDHIYPVSRAIDEQHLIKLNHYTNFQPLWAEDNIKKGNKIQ